MNRRIVFGAVLITAAAVVVVAIGSALAAGGRLELNLVNSGSTTTTFYPLSPDCNASFPKPARLSLASGTGVQYDSPGYAFGNQPASSRFAYTTPAGGETFTCSESQRDVLKL